jgi:hypothetical protein
MVEMWEIEWNSSMIQHGADMGTMEFIFAKGGTLRDFNYVLLNQNDDTWEPLIKAVAERDNSHPDIILKNVSPYGVDQNFRSAVPMNVGGVTTAVQNPRQARQAAGAARVAAAQQRLDAGGNRGRDMAATGQRMRGFAQGVRNIAGEQVAPAASATAGAIMSGAQAGYQGMKAGAGAAKDFAQNTAMPAMRAGAQRAGEGLQAAGRGIAAGAGKARNYLSQKFPGVKQRMGQFMQGVGDYARHGMDAYFGEKDATGRRQGGVREQRVLRQGDRNELNRLQTSEQQSIDRDRQRATQQATPQLRSTAAAEADERQEAVNSAKNQLETSIDERGRNASLRARVRQLGDARRQANQPAPTPNPAALEAAQPVEEQMAVGPEENAMADAGASDDLTEDDMTEPSTEMPTPEAPNPMPVEAPPMSEADTLAMNAVRAAKYSGADQDPSKYRGSTQTQYNRLREMNRDDMTYEGLQSQFGRSQRQKDMFAYLTNELGLSPAEAAKEVETTEVEVPDDDLTEDDMEMNDQLLVSAERLEIKGWDALLKQLNVR